MPHRLSHLLSVYLPVVIWAVFIFFLSAQPTLPGFETSIGDFVFKKSAHMFVYAVLYWLIFRATNANRPIEARNWQVPFILCLLYALLDEFHQSFTPHRSPTLRDAGYDMLGASIAFLRIYRYI